MAAQSHRSGIRTPGPLKPLPQLTKTEGLYALAPAAAAVSAIELVWDERSRLMHHSSTPHGPVSPDGHCNPDEASLHADTATLGPKLTDFCWGLALDELQQLRLCAAEGLLKAVNAVVSMRAGRKVTQNSEAATTSPCTRSRHQGFVALVSMPWSTASMPSIQLATLATALEAEGIQSECHELYLDYAARIGVDLYAILCHGGGFIEEWLFARHYYGHETGNWLNDFRRQAPPLGLGPLVVEQGILDALCPVTEDFVANIENMVDWSRYDLIGLSLTISQLAPSMALARAVKQRDPGLPIVFGGTSCSGPMGDAILRICPYVDVVCRCDGESVLPSLIRRLKTGSSLNDLRGISWRQGDTVMRNPDGGLSTIPATRPPLNYDSYFQRLERLGLSTQISVWLPFESSRGCWYGEKVQCTFCGLHEIMEYRKAEWNRVIGELEHWQAQYGTRRFFAVDLIMPREFFDTLLPAISARGHKWSIFYETKSNMTRQQVETLARAGVTWIQPGIESLNARSLRLMKKGVSPWQNIQLLKWCREFGISVTWNMIVGLPGEDPGDYSAMSKLIKLLWHLCPPSGTSRFQMHRYSPYFEQPEEFGIRLNGAHSLYRAIFPVPKEHLDNLVYLHSYELQSPTLSESRLQSIDAAVDRWQRAHMRGARLEFLPDEHGTARIHDARSFPSKEITLTVAERRLYEFLDTGRGAQQLPDIFERAHPECAKELRPRGGLPSVLNRWERLGLVYSDESRVLALATPANRSIESQHS